MPADEELVFWATTFSYAVAFSLLTWATIFGRGRVRGVSTALIGIGMAFHTATLALRWITAGHAPLGSTYDLNLVATWFAMVVLFIFSRAMAIPRSTGLVILPVVFLLLGMGMTFKTAPEPLSPAYRSNWLAIHVIFAFLAFGCFLLASGAATTFLVRAGRSRRGAAGGPAAPVRALEISAYKLVAIGFVFHGVMLASGSIWANDLWGSYWSWDPVETWSLVTFMIYALYLHLRTFYKWRGRRGAWSVIVAFAAVLISYWGIQYVLPSVHKFDSF